MPIECAVHIPLGAEKCWGADVSGGDTRRGFDFDFVLHGIFVLIIDLDSASVLC
jgi:hypothetical protein